MNRIELESWFDHHPNSTRLRPHDLLDLCESEVHDHAEEIAWRHAQEVAKETLKFWDCRFGLPASEDFVTREVCHSVARELKRHEEHVGQVDESEWLSRSILDSIDPEAHEILREWLCEFAEHENHRIWQQIVSFTHHCARPLIDAEHMTNHLDWNFERTKPRLARRVTLMLVREYAARLRESRREMSPFGLH